MLENESIGLIIKNKRKFLNMTQVEFAEKLGLSDRTLVSRIENGKYKLTKPLLDKIREVLELSSNELEVDFINVSKYDSLKIDNKDSESPFDKVKALKLKTNMLKLGAEVLVNTNDIPMGIETLKDIIIHLNAMVKEFEELLDL